MSNSVIDTNRTRSVLVANTVGNTPLVVHGFNLTDANAMAVAIVDANGDQITSFGGGTQYTDGVAAPAHPIGPTLLWNNGGTWDSVSAANPLPVSGGGGGLSVVDAATWTTAVSSFTPTGGVFNDSATVLSSGTQGTVRLTTNRAFHSNLRNASGTEIATTANPVMSKETDGTNPIFKSAAALADTTSNPTIGGIQSYPMVFNGTTWDREYSAVGAYGTFGAGIQGVGMMAESPTDFKYYTVYADHPSSDGLSATAGFNLFTEAYGYVYNGTTWDRLRGDTTNGAFVQLKTAIPAGSNVIGHVIADSGSTTAVTQATAASLNATVVGTGTFAVQATPITQADTFMLGGVNIKEINAVTPLMGNGTTGTGSLRTTLASDSTGIANYGHGATASSVPANGTYAGARGTTALPTAVSDGQLVGVMTDKYGRIINLPQGPRDIIGQQTTTITASTSETTIATQVASTFLDLVSIVAINTSTTGTRVDFRDSTAGTIRFALYLPAADSRGIVWQVPEVQASVNTNWTAQCGTSVTDVRIYVQWVANK